MKIKKQTKKEMNQVLSIPIIAKPNAGLPQIDENGHTVYDMDAVTFCEEMQLLINAGATFLGGCCGTDENYKLHSGKPIKTENLLCRGITSY